MKQPEEQRHAESPAVGEEDSFSVPDAWRDRVHPRRGGTPGPATGIDPRAGAAVRRRLEGIRPEVDAALEHKRSDAEMARAARAHLGGEPDPLGAAVVAALITSISGWAEVRCESFTDAWAERHGLVFAARATAELSRVLVQYLSSGSSRRSAVRWVKELGDDCSASGFEDIEGAAHRCRELLACADEEVHRQAAAALADHRATQYQRVVVSYLVPGRTEWVEELLATPLTARFARLSPMLPCALGSPGHLALLRERQQDAWLTIARSPHTVAEGVGPALTPTLLALLDERGGCAPAERRAVCEVLAAMPGDDAFRALLTRVDQPGVHEPLLEAMRRFPERALRLLAGAAVGASRKARLTGRLLREHLRAHPESAERVAPGLPEPARRAMAKAARATGAVDEAPPDAVPRPLSGPPAVPDSAAAEAAEVDVHLLPPVLLHGRRQALPVAAVRNLVALLAAAGAGPDGGSGGARAGIDEVRRVCDPVSLDDFGWALFRQTGQEPAWALAALGRLGGDETARRLTPLIRSWPRRGHYRKAVAGLDALVAIGSEVALMHLAGTARRTEHESVRKAAWQRLERLAADRGLPPEKFAEGLVPGFGLDRLGGLTLDYGRRRFTARFDEHLTPYVTDEDGRRRRNLPRPGVRDDQVLAPLAHRRYTGLRRDVRAVAAEQIRRLERAMVTEHRWPLAEFRAHFADHPLLWHVARRLVWTGGHGATRVEFRVAEDRTLADVHDDTLRLPADAAVGVAHPVHLADAARWAEVFADYELLQPFPQLDRPVHTLAPGERDGAELKRFHDVTVPTGRVLGLAQRNWRRVAPRDGVQSSALLELPGGLGVAVELDPGIPVRSPQDRPEQTIRAVRLHRLPEAGPAPDAPRFADLGPVAVCELLADLAALTRPAP
ncbi:hypothetical protein GCM10027168_49830 [Streptomyces capparidis]